MYSKSKQDLQTDWVSAIDQGTFVKDKHEADSVTASQKRFRTVISDEARPQLRDFILSGNFSLSAYQNTNIPHHPVYFMEPNPGTINVAASGVPTYATTTSGTYDAFLVVDSKNDGPHIFGYSAADISDKVTKGEWFKVDVVV